MLNRSNLEDALSVARAKGADVYEKDGLFLMAVYGTPPADDLKAALLRCMYNLDDNRGDYQKHLESHKMAILLEALKPFGVGEKKFLTITSEENKSNMLEELEKINTAEQSKAMAVADAIKARVSIYNSLQKAFDIDTNEDEEKTPLITVPEKFKEVCPHTHRECTNIPTVEWCLKHYPDELMRKPK